MADTIITETFTVSFTYEMTVNTDTGEILGTRLVNKEVNKPNSKVTKSTKTKVEKDEDTTPKLILEDNKYRLNTAAIELMSLESDSKLVLKYEENSGRSIPVIGTNTAFGVSSGNKLTKSNTVACRGNNREELAKHGTEFTIKPHPNKVGIFILVSDKDEDLQLVGDENIKITEEDKVTGFDLDLNELVDEQDMNITEIDSNFFQL